MGTCCAPSSGRRESAPNATAGGTPPSTLIDVPGGSFVMGDESSRAYPGDGEGPAHEVHLRGYAIDRYAVTNEVFAAFVDATGFVSEAERYGWSFVFGGLLPDEFPDTRGVIDAPWWRQVFGASWQHPC